MKSVAILIAAGFALAGCSKKPEPKVDASVNVDLSKAKDNLNGAMDKAGQELKKGANEAKGKLEDAGDALKKDVEAAKDKLSDDKKPGVTIDVKTK